MSSGPSGRRCRPKTAFKGIEQLRPGEMVVLSGSNITHRQYWRWEFPDAGQHRRAPLPALTAAN